MSDSTPSAEAAGAEPTSHLGAQGEAVLPLTSATASPVPEHATSTGADSPIPQESDPTPGSDEEYDGCTRVQIPHSTPYAHTSGAKPTSHLGAQCEIVPALTSTTASTVTEHATSTGADSPIPQESDPTPGTDEGYDGCTRVEMSDSTPSAEAAGAEPTSHLGAQGEAVLPLTSATASPVPEHETSTGADSPIPQESDPTLGSDEGYDGCTRVETPHSTPFAQEAGTEPTSHLDTQGEAVLPLNSVTASPVPEHATSTGADSPIPQMSDPILGPDEGFDGCTRVEISHSTPSAQAVDAELTSHLGAQGEAILSLTSATASPVPEHATSTGADSPIPQLSDPTPDPDEGGDLVTSIGPSDQKKARRGVLSFFHRQSKGPKPTSPPLAKEKNRMAQMVRASSLETAPTSSTMEKPPPRRSTAPLPSISSLQIQYKSNKQLYRAVAKQYGLTCKMSDGCRCLDCQSHYFDCGYEQTENNKQDGGLGAISPICISEMMGGTACMLI